MNKAGTRLLDGAGRQIDYLRLSVTDRCDLRCSYCIPHGFADFTPRADLLRFEEIERVVRIFARLGVRRVRLTGGEPLVRRDIALLAARVAAIAGIDDLSLSTNGTLLARHAGALRRGGVSRLNVSLDSLCRDRVREITGRDVLANVIDGLMAAKTAGFEPIKINMVAVAGITQDEIDAMAEFCLTHNFVLRLIEPMPIGPAAAAGRSIDLRVVRDTLRRRFDLVDGVVPGGGPARYLVSPDRRFTVGFITPLAQHFCDTCNRVRLTADGMLHLCLGQEMRVDLRTLLRGGASDMDLERAVLRSLLDKPSRHDFMNPSTRILRFMAATGG